MARLKSVHVPRGYDGLHIELPGTIVNILTDLRHNNDSMTYVDVSADGDRYGGYPEWWCIDGPDPKGRGTRIVQRSKTKLNKETGA